MDPGESAQAFADRCAGLAALGIEHAVVIAAGPWTEDAVAQLAAAQRHLQSRAHASTLGPCCDTGPMFGRRTKIVATLGPATDPPGVLDRLVEAGVNCVRLNCSHGTHEDLRRRAASVRATAERAQQPLGLLFDLQGPKLRLSAETETRALRAGDAVVFCGTDGSDTPDRVCVDFPHFAALTTERSQIVIGDGVPRLAVERVVAGEVFARVLSPGPLSARKGVNVTYARPELPAITEKDVADLTLAGELSRRT